MGGEHANELSSAKEPQSSAREQLPQTVGDEQQGRKVPSERERRGEQQQTEISSEPTASGSKRRALTKQAASEADLSEDRAHNNDGAELASIHRHAAIGDNARVSVSRPRSNSERVAREESGTARRGDELTHQHASMEADYAPSGETFGQKHPSTSSRHASLEGHDDEAVAGQAGAEIEEPAGRARLSRRSGQPHSISGANSAQSAGCCIDGAGAEEQSPAEQEQEIRRRASRSQPPSGHSTSFRGAKQELVAARRPPASVAPSLASSTNIRYKLENVANVEGPFQDPHLALRASIEALKGSCWSTKVDGMLALVRLASHHQSEMLAHLHEVIVQLAKETRNLRSTVARSAIYTLADLCAKLERSVEPELELIVQALLNKSTENAAFIRDDIRMALTTMVDHLNQWRLADKLINHGANHKNVHVRRMTSQFVALLVDRMGAAKCLAGNRDLSAQLIPALARFLQDSSPHTRYYGRLILSRVMDHGAFERLLERNLSPNLYRSTVGVMESVKRRGAGDSPVEN